MVLVCFNFVALAYLPWVLLVVLDEEVGKDLTNEHTFFVDDVEKLRSVALGCQRGDGDAAITDQLLLIVVFVDDAHLHVCFQAELLFKLDLLRVKLVPDWISSRLQVSF